MKSQTYSEKEVISYLIPLYCALFIYMRWFKIYTALVWCMIPLILIIIVRLINGRKFFMDKNFAKLMFVIFLIYVDYYLGMLYSSNTLGQKSFALPFIFCFFVIIAFYENRECGRRTLNILVVVAAFSSILVLMDYLLPNFVSDLRVVFLQSEANALAAQIVQSGNYSGLAGYTYLSSMFSLILFGYVFTKMLCKAEKNQKIHLAEYAVILFAVITLILGKKKSMLVCLIVGSIAIVLLFLRKNSKVMMKVLFIVIAFGAILFFLMQNSAFGIALGNRFTDVDDISSGRLLIYAQTFEDFKNGSFLIGRGTGSGQDIFASGTHNIYIQILHDNGFIGIFLWISLFFMTLKNSLKIARINHSNHLDYLNVFIQLVFLIYGLFGNPLFNSALILMYFVCVGYTYAELAVIGLPQSEME